MAKEQYNKAISEVNKSFALNLGREYYSLRRGGGRLTIYDEQAIANDLSCIKLFYL